MINKEMLTGYRDLKIEINDLQERICSSQELNMDRMRRMELITQLDIATRKCGIEILAIEREIEKIADTRIRNILRYRYEDGMRWSEIAEKMAPASPDSIRKEHDRFFAKQKEE